MKRGRPPLRQQMTQSLLDILSSNQTPLTISSLATQASKVLGRTLSWNTVQKYLQELVEANRVQAIALPHSKEEGKKGLTVYTLKR